jgi:hypothetical protein
MSGNANETIYFKVFKDATKDFKIRTSADKPVNGIAFFSLFKDTLTKNNFTVGVDEKIYRNQNANGEIAIPKQGLYRIQIQMDTKVVYTPAITTGATFKLFLDTGFKFKIDGAVVNDKPLHIYEIENTTTLPLIEYDFRIENDGKTFGVDFYPTISYKNNAISPVLEMFDGVFDLKNIVITIEKISELA